MEPADLESTRPEALEDWQQARTPTEAAVLEHLHEGAGNASVSRMILRAAAPDALDDLEASKQRDTDIPPHEPGDASEDLLALASQAGGLGAAFGGTAEAETGEAGTLGDLGDEGRAAPERADEETTAPATVHAEVPAQAAPPTPAVDPEITRWSGRRPTTNPDIARWLLEGEGHGFVTFLSSYYRTQIADIRDGNPGLTVKTGQGGNDTRDRHLDIDTSAAGTPLGALVILEALARGHARRWIANPSSAKGKVQVGDLVRYLLNRQGRVADAHATGASADLYSSFDWTGPNGPQQVIQVLEDLPEGSYLIGLPMQGQFFPRSEYLAVREEASIAAARPGERPRDIIQPSLVYWKTVMYTARYSPGGANPNYPWTDIQGSSLAVNRLQSAALRDRITSLAGQGKTIEVMPDFDNHIHVTKR